MLDKLVTERLSTSKVMTIANTPSVSVSSRPAVNILGRFSDDRFIIKDPTLRIVICTKVFVDFYARI